MNKKNKKFEMLVSQFQLMEDEKFQELSLAFVKKKFLEAEMKSQGDEMLNLDAPAAMM